MRLISSLILLAGFSRPLSSLPSSPSLSRRAQQCGQYQSTTTGPYTLLTNGWGWSSGTGSQCSEINSVSAGNILAWDTTWSWANGPNQVKSYTNVQTNIAKKPLGQYTSMPTSWSWSYTGTSLLCNVAYDTFLGPSASSAATYEVMVWLGDYGGASPLSDNGYPPTPIATPTISGTPFNFIVGTNGNVKVYSFVAQSKAATNFSGDLNLFYQWLINNYGLSSGVYLQSIQAGTEVFTGTSAKLTTTKYTIAVN